MAQRLVRRLCPNCKRPDKLSETELRALWISNPSQLSEAQVMKPVGCDQCRNTGYKGRMGIFEIFVIDDDVRHMINNRHSTLLLRQRARELGMRTLREDGVRKVLGGSHLGGRGDLDHARRRQLISELTEMHDLFNR